MTIIADYHEGETSITLVVKKPSQRYFNEFMRLKCAPDLLVARLFPNAKELTESMTAFNAVRKIMRPESFGNKDIIVFDIASGSTPRTAALFACRTRWSTVAIDPIVRLESAGRIQRVTIEKKKIQDVNFYCDDIAVVTAVHAHIKLSWVLHAIHAPKLVLVAMPCCNPLELDGIDPLVQYEDYGCWSPKREVKIYNLERNKDASLGYMATSKPPCGSLPHYRDHARNL